MENKYDKRHYRTNIKSNKNIKIINYLRLKQSKSKTNMAKNKYQNKSKTKSKENTNGKIWLNIDDIKYVQYNRALKIIQNIKQVKQNED